MDAHSYINNHIHTHVCVFYIHFDSDFMCENEHTIRGPGSGEEKEAITEGKGTAE